MKDAGKFEQVVEAWYAPLYRFALSLTHDEAAAADLTQESFRRYASKAPEMNDSVKAKAWLFTTLHRRFLEERRHRQKFPHVEVESADLELPAVMPTNLDAETVREALNQLDEVYRGPVALFYLEDYSYREIAQILEIPIGTVMSRLARGKAALRKLLMENETAPTGVSSKEEEL